jgi:hypothetical protein
MFSIWLKQHNQTIKGVVGIGSHELAYIMEKSIPLYHTFICAKTLNSFSFIIPVCSLLGDIRCLYSLYWFFFLIGHDGDNLISLL